LRSRKNYPKGYDSKFEYTLHTKVLKGWEHHSKLRIEYVESHKYEPDFVKKVGTVTYLVESKGRFRTSGEAAKYIFIRSCLPPKHVLIFLFQSAFTAMPHAKRRMDGSRYMQIDWAEKNGFEWYTAETFPRGLR